jgi:hypothetical protein
MVALLGTAEATIVPSVTFKCTPVPEDCDGWYQSDVAIEWTVLPSDAETTGCENRDFKTDIVTTVSCRAVDGSVSMTVDVEIKVDKTPPEVTGARPARSADVDGWYNHAVEVKFDGEDVTSGKGACTATTYGGPDSASATVEGRCFDKAGNVSKPLYYDLKYDETAPAVTAARTDRPPDYAGWYTAPVRLAVEATDATSGLAECPTVTYGGPDSATVSVIGTCRDQAGNVASRTFPLSFDATAPLLTRVAASGGDRRVMLRWLASGGAISAEVVRSPGRGGAPSSVVFRGAGAAFEDTRVVNGTRYTYEVRARDAAGNLGTRTVTAVPKPRLIAPAPGAVTQAGKPPVLRWTPVRRARYYNVQLFRGGRKLLSAWPARARFPLRRMWTHEGERVRLTPGEYKWIVWPGYGARAKSDYGERIGVRKFTVRAARR